MNSLIQLKKAIPPSAHLYSCRSDAGTTTEDFSNLSGDFRNPEQANLG
jgi:hypothetical protein